jgi:DNA-directed RNA polymerase
MPYTDRGMLEALELEREVEAISLGENRYWRSLHDGGTPELEFINEAGAYLLPAVTAIRNEIAAHHGGKFEAWYYGFAWLSDEHITVSLLKSLLNKTSRAEKSKAAPDYAVMQSVGYDLARSLKDLAQYHNARSTFEEQWLKQSYQIKNWNARQRLRFTKKVLDLPKQDIREWLRIAIKLLQVAELGGLAETTVIRQRGKTSTYVRLKPYIYDELYKRHEIAALARPKAAPMICPPNPYSYDEHGNLTGGYLLPSISPRIVRPATPGYEREGITVMGETAIAAANAIQATPFRLNEFIFEALATVYYSNTGLGDTPESSKNAWDFPNFQGETKDANGKVTPEFSAHLTKREEAWTQWYRSESHRLRMEERLMACRDIRQFPAYYLPVTADFRTRLYTATELLSPQGSDFDKALCCFADRIPQTPAGVRALKIHVANCFGIDKVSYDERVAWVDKHEAVLRACAQDPLEHRFWSTDADEKKKWQALAAIHDLYVNPEWTSVPVQRDGSCNGIQHWSAIGLDPVGAKATNLLPSAQPNDLYSEVAEKTLELLSGDDSDWAARWSNHVTRKVAKRPCMTYPYGVTSRGVTSALIADGHCDWLDPRERFEGSRFLTGFLFDQAIPSVVSSSYHFMTWIKGIARTVSKAGNVLTWETPAGSVIHHGYYKLEDWRLSVENQRLYFTLPQCREVPELDKDGAANGIAPNFIHSMDAAHMQICVRKMLEHGIRHFSMIHDSYGCPAPYVDLMQRLIREAFLEMYLDTDWAQAFLDRVQVLTTETLPPVPTRGSLDLQEILEADYFFA